MNKIPSKQFTYYAFLFITFTLITIPTIAYSSAWSMDETPFYDQESPSIARGDQGAGEKKFYGLLCGNNGYEKNVAAARDFLSWQAEEGEQWAGQKKFYGLVYGSNGYEKNVGAAHEFLSWRVEEGDQWAGEAKFYGLLCGNNGYDKNVDAAHEFLSRLVKKSAPWAYEEQFNALLYGSNDYEKNLAAVCDFLSWQAEEGNQGAISQSNASKPGASTDSTERMLLDFHPFDTPPKELSPLED